MTLQLRPTFSESWYRVKDLKPKVRAAAQISRQYYRGERWYVVRDPAGNQFHRLSDVAYRFVGLLDGTRTVGEAWELVGGQLADDAPTQPEVIQILTQLYAANLIETNISPDAQVLLRRHKKQRQRKTQQRLMNLLFPRIPLWDPDNFLKRWMPLAGPLISRGGMFLWIGVVALAVLALIPNLGAFATQTQSFLQSGSVEMWLLLGLTFFVTKFLHEMGHAFTCRKFGGEVHEIGIMFLVLMPCPYVDASTAWGFPSKWKRILVATGGMIAELFVAALAAFVWLVTDAGHPINQIAYYTMLIAGISTILFNANPLLRYDGYYILSDWLEIPNLQQKSREYTLGLVKRYIFRVKSNIPLPATTRQKLWLVAFSVLSTVYRIFIGFAIILMVIYQLPPAAQLVGYFLAAGAIVTFFVVPAFKLVKYLTTDPELHRKRTRAWGFTLATTGVIVLLVGGIPAPSWVRAEGISEPLERELLAARTPGFVEEVLVADGARVEAGTAILRLRNEDLVGRIEAARYQLRQAEVLWDAARVTDPAEASIAQQQLQLASSRLRKLLDDEAALTLRAPVAGRVVAPRLDHLPGTFLNIGDAIGRVDEDRMLEIYIAVGQNDYERIYNEETRDIQIRLASDPRTTLHGTSIETVDLSQRATNTVRSAALIYTGGGKLAPDPAGRDPRQTAENVFEFRVTLANPNGAFLPGQRAHVRINLENEPLARQWWRSFLQLIQTQRTPARPAAA